MTPSTETLVGKIERYDERTGLLHIAVPYSNWPIMVKRGYSKCLVQFSDERILSHKQRNAVYALLGALADWSGTDKDEAKSTFKTLFNLRDEIVESGHRLISLADAPMALVCEFQKFLINFILEYDVPCDFDILQFVDDIPSYIYACLIHKKCAVCGRRADLHHSTHKIGIGRDRTSIVQLGMDVQPLCRTHHDEAHVLGQKTFDEKYKLCSVPLDKSLCSLYRLKAGDPNSTID